MDSTTSWQLVSISGDGEITVVIHSISTSNHNVAESLDKKKILIGECKWTSGENAAVLENELRWKASMLPFAKGKEVVPVIFAKNATNQTDTAIVITPEGIIDLMK